MKVVIVRHLERKWLTKTDEIRDLAEAANYETVVEIEFVALRSHPKYFLPQQKLENLMFVIEENDISKVIIDGAISPKQFLNLEEITGLEILDKTMLVLEIFSNRANSIEIKLQVQLAQLKYSIPRSVNVVAESVKNERPGFGGTGETITELFISDIRRRVRNLEKKISQIKEKRHTSSRSDIPKLPIMGFYSAGKTSLFNLLTDIERETGPEAFTTMVLKTGPSLVCGYPLELIDTVGLIELPRDVSSAFDLMLTSIFEHEAIIICLDGSLSIEIITSQLNEIINYSVEFSKKETIRVIYFITKTDQSEYDNIDLIKDYIHSVNDFDEYRIIESRMDEGEKVVNDFIHVYEDLFEDKLIHYQYPSLSPSNLSYLYEISRVTNQTWNNEGKVSVEGTGLWSLQKKFERELKNEYE